jgi:hypothetical protein
MKTWMKLMIVGALSGAALVGCGDDDDTPPPPPAPDGGMMGTGVRSTIFYIDPDTGARTELATPDINADVASAPGSGTAADRSCSGAATNIRPVETTPDVAVAMTVKDFESDNPVDNVVVQFYRNNELPPPMGGTFSCTDSGFPCQMGTSDAAGVVPAVMDAGESWYAYFIKGRTGPTPASTPVDTAQYNEAAGASVTGNSVAQSTLNIIPTVLGLTRQSGTAIVAGTVYDCADEPVRGLVVRMFKEDGDNTTATGDTFIPDSGTRTGPGFRYFDGDGFPAGDQPYSNVDGLYAAANLPVDAPVRVEAWYNAGTASAPDPQLWGCERIRVFPNGVTIVNIRPTRSDITGCTE